MIGLLTIVAVGFLLGMRHATDPDHMIAVSTIVSREHSVKRSALIGAAWGLVHTLIILIVGSAMIVFRVALPARVGLAMEFAVAVMLIFLGLRNLRGVLSWSARRIEDPAQEADHGRAGYHAHGDYIHTHSHGRNGRHRHDPQRTPLTLIDRWFAGSDLYLWARPLLVGIVHGLAGSAAIALLVLSIIPSVRWAVAYLVVFGGGTILGMMLITVMVGSTFAYGQRRFSRIGNHFHWAAGLLSVGFGLFIAYQVGFV